MSGFFIVILAVLRKKKAFGHKFFIEFINAVQSHTAERSIRGGGRRHQAMPAKLASVWFAMSVGRAMKPPVI